MHQQQSHTGICKNKSLPCRLSKPHTPAKSTTATVMVTGAGVDSLIDTAGLTLLQPSLPPLSILNDSLVQLRTSAQQWFPILCGESYVGSQISVGSNHM